jgi:hypothetical protein
MRRTEVWGYSGAHEFERLATRVAACVVRLVCDAGGRTPPRSLGGSALVAGSGSQIDFSAQLPGLRSRTRAKFARRSRLIREKVIGRSMRTVAARSGRRSPLVGGRSLRVFRPLVGTVLASGGSFALLHQPPRQHGRGVFFQPGIEQLRDLLSEIGGMAEPRKLITLQRVPRRREKELPRWLGSVVQGDLQRKRRHIINTSTIVKSTHVRTYCGKLCKSFPAKREPSTFTSSTGEALGCR